MRQVLADDQLAVTDFRRREFELEDIFMKIIEGGTDDNGK
jgi:hypothetical protein